MTRKIFLCGLIVCAFVIAPSAYAGKMELTTYYPAPNGEYDTLQSNSLGLVPRTAASMPACDAAHEGLMYYNQTDKVQYACDGTSWNVIGGKVLTWSVSGDPGYLATISPTGGTGQNMALPYGRDVTVPCNGRLVVTLNIWMGFTVPGMCNVEIGPSIDGMVPRIWALRLETVGSPTEYRQMSSTTDAFVNAGTHEVRLRHHLDAAATYPANGGVGFTKYSFQIQFFPSQVADA